MSKTLTIAASLLALVLASFATSADDAGPARGLRYERHERYLYVATIAQGAQDPDFVTVVGADPRHRDFGQIVNRVDKPNVGDELHHIGYSHDQKRLIDQAAWQHGA